MKKRMISVLLLSAILQPAMASSNADTTIEKAVQSDIPNGWQIEQQITGDLNKDKLKDVVLIVKENNPAKLIDNKDSLGADTLDTNRRGIMVFFRNKGKHSNKSKHSNKAYRLIEQNLTGFIPSENSLETPCLLDPLAEVEINKNVLKVSFSEFYSCGSYGVFDSDYIFRYQNKGFELIGFDTSSFSRATGEIETTSVNFSTKKKAHTTGENMFADQKSKPKTTWQKIKINKLYRLKDWNGETSYNILEKYN